MAMKVRIKCGTLEAFLFFSVEDESHKKTYVQHDNGERVSPGQFESLGGYGKCKKWKWSFKVCEGGQKPVCFSKWLNGMKAAQVVGAARVVGEAQVVGAENDDYSVAYKIKCVKCFWEEKLAIPDQNWLFVCKNPSCRTAIPIPRW